MSFVRAKPETDSGWLVAGLGKKCMKMQKHTSISCQWGKTHMINANH